MSGLLAIVNARFQNILCYCLSAMDALGISVTNSFQNILCYCLSKVLSFIQKVVLDFKTSYVIVYQVKDQFDLDAPLSFQNILCYCLSCIGFQELPCAQFQNILCYCLSLHTSLYDLRQIRFQNILCYCLSAFL